MRRAFTLIELLVVITIVAVLAAILFPVFAQAKQAAKKTACLTNTRQLGIAAMLYVADYDGLYPQDKRTSAHPEVEDADGSIDDPDNGSVFTMIFPYTGAPQIEEAELSEQRLFACPSDPKPFDPDCEAINEEEPFVTSYLVNAAFAFGRNESDVEHPSDTIYFAERRSEPVGSVPQYCEDIYHPWFNPSNPQAPTNDMDPLKGAIATTRHGAGSNYVFADGHAKTMRWTQTYAPPTVNLHVVK